MSPIVKSSTSVRVFIDDKSFSTRDLDQEAAALLRLAGRDPRTFDLFILGENGVEEMIRDGQIINLKDDERFVTRQRIRFTIDGESFNTYDDDQAAASLLRLAGVDPAGYDLARILSTGATQSFSDDTIVTLADDDEFVTTKHVGGVA